jgi:hypothetical protein
MSRRRTAFLAAGALAVGLFAAGCSSSTPAPEASPSTAASASTGGSTGAATAEGASAVIKQAAENTSAQQTAKLMGDVAIEGGGANTAMKLDGIVDFSTGNMSGSLTADIFGQNATMQFLSVDGTTYIQMPMFGDKWIKSPAEAGLSTSDPMGQLDSLKDVADLEEVGTEDVNGVSTTHYTGTIDLQAALKSAGLPKDQVKAAEKALAKPTEGATIDVWVDDQQRIVKVRQSVSLNVDGQGDSGLTSTMTFSDFGTELDVTAPDPADVIDAGKLANMAQGQASQG